MASFTFFLFAATLTGLLLVTPASSQYYNHLLSTTAGGERLKTGQALVQGGFSFIIQSDCNLVLYDFGKEIWSSQTAGKGTGCYADFTKYGNLLIFNSRALRIWWSGPFRNIGNYILILQKDRNVVIYSLPNWATGTNTVGSAGVVIAGERNGTVGVSGAEQNKVTEMGKMVDQFMSDE